MVVSYWRNFDNIMYLTYDTFAGISSNATLHVPEGTLALYQDTEPWRSSFKTILEFDAEEDDMTAIKITHHDFAVKAGYGNLSISGLENGESVSLYNTNGVCLGTSTPIAGTVTFCNINENIAIVKIGRHSIKVQL